jgi:hypothetical protein
MLSAPGARSVVNNYAATSFDKLDRRFAGASARRPAGGDSDLARWRRGELAGNGVFMPLVFDLDGDSMHWLDVYSKRKPRSACCNLQQAEPRTD